MLFRCFETILCLERCPKSIPVLRNYIINKSTKHKFLIETVDITHLICKANAPKRGWLNTYCLM